MTATPTYAINLFDADGDVTREGIFLFFGDTIIKVAESKEDFAKFLAHISCINEEIQCQ